MDPDRDPSVVANIQGTEIGEYFGASLATGDLDKDGLHDLIVGAPHWGNDKGRVYIYLGNLEVNYQYYTMSNSFSKPFSLSDENETFYQGYVHCCRENSKQLQFWKAPTKMHNSVMP